MQWLQNCFSWTLSFSLFQLSLPSLCLLLLFLTPGFWPQSPAAENWWVARYPLHSPYERHVRLQAWLDNHNSLNGIFWNAVISNVLWTCWSSFVLYRPTGKLDTQGNRSFCSVKRNVKVTYILQVLKLINQWIFCWLFFILPMFLSFTSTHVQKLM